MVKLEIFKLEWDEALQSYEESGKLYSHTATIVPRIGETVYIGLSEYIVNKVVYHFDPNECIEVVEIFVILVK